MSSSTSELTTLIQTKLHRPKIPINMVHRPRLIAWLDERRQRPLTLVSAPAGYGKSTLISSWLDTTCECPNAWLSLDEGDNDLVEFITYFLASIRTIFPEAGTNTLTLLRAPNLPPLKELAINLTNEIIQIGEFFVLVLDDYEVIQNDTVHDFINELLVPPPPNMNLVLCTRIDPPVSLLKLRAQSQLTEIRAQDLRFSVEEAHNFLQKMLGTTVDIATAKFIEEQSEGWVTGIQLAALAFRHRVGSQDIEERPTVNNRYVSDYLLSEILDSQATGFSEWLLKTSILARFNAGLCEAVCLNDPELDGDVFMEWLVTSNLFAIPLDDHNHWVRYHHLFREFLQTELTRRYANTEVVALHVRASDWFNQNGLIDEALYHALAAGDISAASQLVEQNMRTLLNQDQWHILEKWLAHLPGDIIRQRPELLIAKTWGSYYRFALSAIPPLLETIETLLDDEAITHPLWGEFDFFWGHHWYWQGQNTRSLDLFCRALERIPEAYHAARGEAELCWGLASQMSGQKTEAVRRLNRWLYNEQTPHPSRQTKLLGSLIFLYLLSGELTEAALVTRQIQDVAEKNNNTYVETWSSYLLGYIHYCWNDLGNAADHFTQVVEKRYFVPTAATIDSLAGLALTYQAMGQSKNAKATISLLLEFAQETNNLTYITIAHSCQARLSLLRGDLASAVRWLQTADLTTGTGIMFYWLEVPRITQCRVLIAQGSTASLEEAAEKLQNYQQTNETEHNTRQSIDVLLLQALAYHKLKQDNKALTTLERAVTLAEPGGWIRPFVEPGTEMVQLLSKLVDQQGATKYISEILVTFEPAQNMQVPTPAQPALQLTESLTNRESEILELLGKRLSNKEIAAELHITVGTVQQHLNHIYAKLSVKGRQQAITKAYKLNRLLTPK